MQATISAGLIEDRSALEWDERVNAWPVEELKECVSTVQQNVARGTDFPRRIFAPVQGEGGFTLCMPDFSLVPDSRLHLVGLEQALGTQARRSSREVGCVRCPEVKVIGGARTGFSLCRMAFQVSQKSSARTLADRTMWQSDLYAQDVDEPEDADKMASTIFQGQERSRLQIMEELRKFIKEDASSHRQDRWTAQVQREGYQTQV